MVLPVLARERIQQLVDAAGEELDGDWVLVGGALATLWFSPQRVTEDIDLISVVDGPERRYQLMNFALVQGVPLEAVNSAADFFLRRIPDWTKQLELLHAGARARIFRPTPTLFLLLKTGRMSEADLGDCLALIDLAKRTGLAVDRARVCAHLGSLPDPESAPASARRNVLRAALGSQDDGME
jgi:hypothetical protein